MSSKPLSLFHPRLWGRENHQQAWPLDAKTAARLMLCVALLSLVGWLYLTQASQMANTGHSMRLAVDDIEKIERGNALLRYQISQLEALPRIEARARQLGFGPTGRATYLVTSDYPATPEMIAASATPESWSEPAQTSADTEPGLPTTTSSLLDFWAKVKAQFMAWVGSS